MEQEAYNSRKAAQVVARFASMEEGQRLHIVKAMKLVYLADRKSIERTGFPMLDEPRVSMRHGPVNSFTYDRAKGEVNLTDDPWADFVSARRNHALSPKEKFSEDDLDELSEFDLEVIQEIWAEFGGERAFDLADWTHESDNVPEWEDPGYSSLPIPLRRIMQHVGIPNATDQTDAVEEAQYAAATFNRLTERYGKAKG